MKFGQRQDLPHRFSHLIDSLELGLIVLPIQEYRMTIVVKDGLQGYKIYLHPVFIWQYPLVVILRAGWTVYNFPFSHCPDQPSIAWSNDKLAISANDFANNCHGGFTGVQYTIVDKNDLLTGFGTPRFWQSNENLSEFSVHPVQIMDIVPSSTLYMVSVASGGSGSVKVYALTGEAPFIQVSINTLPIHPIIVPPQGQQPNRVYMIDTGDARMLDSAIHKGKLWLTLTDGCRPANDTVTRSCVRLAQLDITNNKVIQDFDVGMTHSYLYYPAISIDVAGNLDLIYGMSSSTVPTSLYAAGQTINSTLNTLNSPVNLTLGSGIEQSGRFGDYFAVANDPSNSLRFWVSGEYNPNPSPSPEYWSTFIGNFTTSIPSNQIHTMSNSQSGISGVFSDK